MSTDDHTSNKLAAKVDHLIEYVTPTLTTAAIAAVPLAAEGHLGKVAAVGLVAVDRGLAVAHGVVHPMAHTQDSHVENAMATTNENKVAQTTENKIETTNEVKTENNQSVEVSANTLETTPTIGVSNEMNNEVRNEMKFEMGM